MTDNASLDRSQLNRLLGERVRYQGVVFEIVDVLEDGPALVLENPQDVIIQPNQYGEAQRRVPVTVTVPVWKADGSGLHPEFLKLETLIQA